MNIAIIGLGLIGGSMAKTAKAKTDHKVMGYDISGAVLEQAEESGAIDERVYDDLSDVDLLLLALYPQDSVHYLETHRKALRPGSTVVDLCGVKRYVCEHVGALLRESDVTFIGGHPMAGREFSGFSCSMDGLFQGASMILTPDQDTPQEKVDAAGDFFLSLGFGHIQIATPDHHDEVIAFTSQLAHVLSSAYVQCPTARQHMGFSAGSFQDLTRVAKLNEYMWTELFLHNADYLTAQIDELIINLRTFQRVISRKDEHTLLQILREGREIKEELSSGTTR